MQKHKTDSNLYEQMFNGTTNNTDISPRKYRVQFVSGLCFVVVLFLMKGIGVGFDGVTCTKYKPG